MHTHTETSLSKNVTVLCPDDIVQPLESALSGLKELGALSIRRADSLISLSFLKGLKVITGNTLIDG